MKIIALIVLSALSLFAIVDINSASAEEFSSLKGIGSSKSGAIISYRKEVKCFKSIDELINVKGIGKATVSKNKSNLKVGPCK